MKVKVLGCHGGNAPGYDTTSYMINDSFLIDAGSLCSTLTLDQQKNITDVVITHSHLDHIKDLCFLLENTYHKKRTPLKVYSVPKVIENLKNHIFNNLIWPDFTQFKTENNQPILIFHEVRESFSIDNVEIKPFKVNHPANAVGYLLDDGENQLVFTGDSGPTEKTWEIANSCQNLKAIFTEISFPTRMESLAQVSGHYTLKTLSEDIKKLKTTNTPIYIGHFKPLFLEELLNEFQTNAINTMTTLHADDELQFL